MSSTEIYGGVVVIARAIGMVLLVLVMRQQIAELAKKSKLKGLKQLLLGLVAFEFVQGILPIYNNYLRFTNGHQNEAINNITFITGGAGFLAVGIGWYLIYKYRVRP